MEGTILDEVDGLPTEQEFQLIGAINVGWSLLDSVVTACLFSTVKIDPFDFLTLIGRVEAEAKLAKVAQILKRRKDPKGKKIMALKNELSKGKGLRNALTHGQFEGRTKEDFLMWSVTSEIVDTEEGPAKKLIVLSGAEIADHFKLLFQVLAYLRANFPVEEMRPILQLPSHVDDRSQASQARGSDRTQRPRRVQRLG